MEFPAVWAAGMIVIRCSGTCPNHGAANAASLARVQNMMKSALRTSSLLRMQLLLNQFLQSKISQSGLDTEISQAIIGGTRQTKSGFMNPLARKTSRRTSQGRQAKMLCVLSVCVSLSAFFRSTLRMNYLSQGARLLHQYSNIVFEGTL